MRRRNRSTTRRRCAALPAALVGSIALSLLAPAAHAAGVAETWDAGHPAFSGVPAADSATQAGTYTVQPSDTVSAIAARHGLRTVDVLAWNGLGWSSIIHPGQVLQFVAASAAPAPPEPATPAPAPTPAVPPAPGPTAGSHTIVAGETMSAVARRYGVSTDALLAANGLGRSSIIYPGQTVTIPSAPVAASPVPEFPVAASPVAAPASSPVALDDEQAANAQLIIRVGRSLGVPERGIAIALATAMQESSLRNLDHGPDDSLGLFQQRPSMGWGTAAEVRDPERATLAFFGGPGDPNGSVTRGLLDIPGWVAGGFTEAAQAVQISAYPARYAAWEQSAYIWLATLL